MSEWGCGWYEGGRLGECGASELVLEETNRVASGAAREGERVGGRGNGTLFERIRGWEAGRVR